MVHSENDRFLSAPVADVDFCFLLEKLGARVSRQNIYNASSPDTKDSNFLKFSATDREKSPYKLVRKRIDSELTCWVPKNDEVRMISRQGCLTNISWRCGTSRRVRSTEMDLLGPGSYDTSLFYQGKYTSDAVATMKYSPANKISETMKRKKKMKELTIVRDSQQKTSPASLDAVEVSHNDFDCSQKLLMKISESSRWSAPEYRTESYIKTTGMQLSLDYDKFNDKKIPLSITGHSDRESSSTRYNKSKYEYNTDFAITVDSGNQISFDTHMRQNPLKFSTAFKSKIDSGPYYPAPTSGTLLGPGSFPGADTSSLIIKNPNKKSPSFLGHKQVARPDTTTKLPLFTQTNKKVHNFNCEDASANSDDRLSDWTKQKLFKYIQN